MSKSFNFVISSIAKMPDETNNRVSVQLNEPIYIRDGEECEVCMKLFHTTKTFYSVIDGVNNTFKIVVYNNNQNHQGEILHDWTIVIPEGNYNISTLFNELKILCFEKLAIAYDSRLNKFLFTNAHHGNNHTHLETGTAGAFLGYDDNTTIHFDDITSSHYSDKPINVAGFDNIILQMGGNLALDYTYTNLKNTKGDNIVKIDRILGIIPISEVMPMDTIKLEGGACEYKSLLVNKVIDRFDIIITNEKLQNINIGDWYMVLGFHINDVTMMTRFYKLVNKIATDISDISYYILKFMKGLA
ncbi:MAG TPA: hypothetical protein V6C58_24310 [Allocoleopsis sp.]